MDFGWIGTDRHGMCAAAQTGTDFEKTLIFMISGASGMFNTYWASINKIIA